MRPSETPVDFLRGVAIFAGLADAVLERVAARGEWIEVPAGEYVFRENEPARELFVLRSGRLDVVREAGDAEVMIRALSPGAVLGELAVLTGASRSASVRARRDSHLLRVGSDTFVELLKSDPEFAVGLTRTLAGQLQASRAVTLPSDPVPPVIAIVSFAAAAQDEGAAAQLAERLGRWRTVKLLTAADAEAEGGYAAALDRWERADDQVVLAVGPTDSGAWSDFALRQADRALVLAHAGPPPRLDPRLVGADVVLLDWPDSRRELPGWVEALEPRSIHKLRRGPGAGEDLDVLARKLAGRSVGVVLSGGGARGFAHIGVLEQLIGAGVRIDRVAGCSMGALIGALFATGAGPDEIAIAMRAELIERNPLSDYTLPLAALVRGRKAEAMLLRLFADVTIEELPREFFCVSCDLVSSELIVHRRGPLYRSVGASFCLPGIGPPVASDGQLLVDGGVLNNLPVETMAARGEGPVVAVDVSSRFEPPARDAADLGRPRLRRLSHRMRRAVIGWDEPLPSFTETITRAVVLGSIDTAEAAQRHADLVIAPAVQGIGLTEFDRIDEIRAQGAAAAGNVLEGLPQDRLDDLAARSE